MIAEVIALTLSNIPVVMFVAALVVASLTRRPSYAPQRFFNWLLLLSIGVEALWGGLFHVFLPDFASAQIGWQPSPFEFEVGVSDISLGLVAIAAFWRSNSFKSAVAVYATLFNAGVLIGHIRQAIGDGNFASNNMGAMQVITALHVVLLPLLLMLIWRRHETAHGEALQGTATSIR